MFCYKIADQIIGLDFMNDLIHENMLSFKVDDNSSIGLSISLEYLPMIQQPTQAPIISTPYIKIHSLHNQYILSYLIPSDSLQLRYNFEKKKATIILSHNIDINIDNYNHSLDSDHETQTTKKDIIFYAIRDAFFLYAQEKGIIAVHSSSIIYNNKAYLFSASSGTGKTTHTNFWIENYNSEILDGDVTAICIEDEEAIAYGLPWCGTSNKFINKKVSLGGVIFLSQSCRNNIYKLTLFDSILNLSARCFTPTWTTEMANKNMNIASLLAPKIICAHLECKPELEAAAITKTYIDKFL